MTGENPYKISFSKPDRGYEVWINGRRYLVPMRYAENIFLLLRPEKWAQESALCFIKAFCDPIAPRPNGVRQRIARHLRRLANRIDPCGLL